MARPVNMPVFLEGYAEVLRGVATAGDFRLHGLRIHAPAGVYSPHETSSTRFVLDHFFALGLDRPGGTLLEIGCGAGAISLLAARNGWSVVAGDIDPVAVAATLHNAAQNDLEVDARVSDLFSAFPGELFDVIVFNQPFFHVERETAESERTLSDFGGKLHARYMAEAKNHIKPGGYLVVVYSNCSNEAVFAQPGWRMELRACDFDAGSDYIRALFKATREDCFHESQAAPDR